MTVVAIDAMFDAGVNDETIRIGFEHRRLNVYPHLEAKGLNIVRCQGANAVREIVKQEVVKSGVDYLTGIGHGEEETKYTGNFSVIFGIDRYDKPEVEGKIIHFLSCGIGNELGADFVNKGCLAFFGYSTNFSFTKENADAFLDCDSEIDRAIADGLTADEVFNRAIIRFNERIDELLANGHIYPALMLETCRDHLCAPSINQKWGLRQAKISPAGNMNPDV